MRKLKLQVQMSVDGFVAGPNGELDWMTWDRDEKLNALIHSLADSSDTILLGRKMTDGFVTHWENVVNNQPDNPDFSLAQKMVDIPKVVFTKTLDSSPWRNTKLATGNVVDEIAKLKKKDGKDIIVYGGATFVSSLIKEGLVDEFNLFVHPVLINKGMRIFDTPNRRQKLILLDATVYDIGVTVLKYKPA